MDILYVSSMCSDNRFKELFELDKNLPHQAQKFHSLLARGLAVDNSVLAMTALPVPSKCKTKWFRGSNEREGELSFSYLPFINFPIFRHLCILVFGFVTCLRWALHAQRDSRAIVCDVLNLSSTLATLLPAKLLGIKRISIVTDIPQHLAKCSDRKMGLIERLVNKVYTLLATGLASQYDGYVLLTEFMKPLVNSKDKPYIVVEGLVDTRMQAVTGCKKYNERVILYAGALRENNGLRNLIEAFMLIEGENTRLWLFGGGEMDGYIRKCEALDHRIKMFGVVPNDLVVQEQLKATFLVNPRPSDHEFTKYSFPSKNMEYMASGTPVITTLLPGMPKEYTDYVYLFKDETVQGFRDTLTHLLALEAKELERKGTLAKDFVLGSKNNNIQAKRIIRLIRAL